MSVDRLLESLGRPDAQLAALYARDVGSKRFAFWRQAAR